MGGQLSGANPDSFSGNNWRSIIYPSTFYSVISGFPCVCHDSKNIFSDYFNKIIRPYETCLIIFIHRDIYGVVDKIIRNEKSIKM